MGKDEVERILTRLLCAGWLDQLPRKLSDKEVLMALAASSLKTKQQYSEKEVNAHLLQWLEGFTYPSCIDHVTVRRYLVDLRFIKRNPSGSLYWTNEVAIASILEPGARNIHPRDILLQIQHQREQRKRNRFKK